MPQRLTPQQQRAVDLFQALEAFASELEGDHRLRAAEGILRLAGVDEGRKGGLGVRPFGSADAAAIERERKRSRELDELLSSL